jgi:uncharacterized membrane protein
MSRKFIERESPRWIEQGIVTGEQAERILGLYEDRKHAVGLIPLFGSLLVGLGFLSFVAANWQGMHELFRLVLIIAVMAGCYACGHWFTSQGSQKLGISLIGIGLFAFGGGIFLVGQMFHLTAYDAGSFLIWGLAGFLVTWLYRSRFLFLLSLAIITAAQIYSISSFSLFSYYAFGGLLLLAAYWWYNRNVVIGWLLQFSIIVESMVFIGSKGWPVIWYIVVLMALYTLFDWIGRKEHYSMQAAPILAAFAFGLFLVFIDADDESFFIWTEVPVFYYLVISGILLAASLYAKRRAKREQSAFEWLLFLPFFLIGEFMEVFYLLSLFLFSLFLLWQGYREAWRFKINLATVLFVISSMLAYVKMAWDFMDKSLAFLIGGLLLLGLSAFMNRRNRQFLKHTTQEESRHE